MISRLLKWLKDSSGYAPPCTCGQEANGKCTVRIKIVGEAGVAEQSSERLLQCGKVKQMIRGRTR